MEAMSQKEAKGRLQLPTRQALGEGNRVRRNNHQGVSMPPRPRSTCTCSNRPGFVRCSKHGNMVPSGKLRRHQANKELLTRALAPPNRRYSGRVLKSQGSSRIKLKALKAHAVAEALGIRRRNVLTNTGEVM
ncbi:hypothetical protein SADUNF_Sadunf11G0087200 [Salix dunnii]|uniref:Uncharacterized protein n=1 Tax=Salix dunnii TaxID=1413687 RepID=A0A835JN87_9ROSI|nr:hypothetical protein SADUNF_Sadunf11G0087200 [Salix dunnii]